MHPNVSWRVCDLLDARSTRELIGECSASHLLHLAWLPVHGNVMRAPENLDWIKASLTLVQAFKELGGVRAAAVGSSAEYCWDQGACVNGVTPLTPRSLYGASKLALQIALSSYADVVGLGFVWPRVFFVYGPGEHDSRLVASIVRSLLHGEEAECTAGTQRRDYLYVTDAANGIVTALESNHTGPIDIASGNAIEVREMAIAVAREAGKPELLKLGAKPSPEYLPPMVLGDPREAERILKWSPHISLDEGVSRTVAWGRTAFLT